MKQSSLNDLYVGWKCSKVTIDEEMPSYSTVEGVLSLGAVNPEDDEDCPTFQEFRVSIGADHVDGKDIISRHGVMNFLDKKVKFKSIVGTVIQPGQDREIHEVAMYALAGYDLKDSITTTIAVEILEQCSDGERALATMRFEGHDENCSAFFAVWLITRSSTEYGCHYTTGKTDYSPEGSYMEDTCDMILRQFYPSVDF